MEKKAIINLMNLEHYSGKLALMWKAPRCRARSKRSGNACRAPAVRGKRVCYKHGAGAGAPSGQRNGMYRHGGRTKAAVAERQAVASLLRATRELIKGLQD